MSFQIPVSGEFERNNGKHAMKKRYVGPGRATRAALWAVVMCALAGSASALQHMEQQYNWGFFEFAFDSDQQRQELSARADFAPQNSTPFDVDVDEPTGRVFLSFPGFLRGSPVALATVKDRNRRDSPQLAPYPDWSWHAGHRGCDGLTSVFRIYIDKCRRLWVIDCGRVDILNTYEQKCPPQLFIFDLKTNNILIRHRFTVPDEYRDSTLMLNVIAEHVGASCNNSYAYIADASAFALYVFSLRSQRSWRISSDTFLPDANASYFKANGSSFELYDGILSLTQNEESLFYHSFTSFEEGKVRKSVLRNESMFITGTNLAAAEFKFIGSRDNQSAGEALAKNRVMFFHQMGTDSIYCWDASTNYTKANHHEVEHDDNLLHFVVSMKTIGKEPYEKVWAIDNNGQHLFDGTFQPSQPNTVNIVQGSVKELSFKCKGRRF